MPPTSEDHHFYRLVTLSLKISPMVLRRVIKQFCDVHGLAFDQLLNIYKHELFHYHGNHPCCQCNGRTLRGIIQDHQWQILFKDISATLPSTDRHHGHDKRRCPLQYGVHAGVTVDVCDVSLACSLIINIAGTIKSHAGTSDSTVIGLHTSTKLWGLTLNIAGLLEYVFDQHIAKIGGLQSLLASHLHVLFHAMETQQCCQCGSNKESKGKISVTEWKVMYCKSGPPCNPGVCSCQYTVQHSITRAGLSTRLIHTLGQNLGPLVSLRSVRNEIAHSMTGTLDDNKFRELWNRLSGNLNDLIDIIHDPTWTADMRSQILDLETCHIDGQMWDEYRSSLQEFKQEFGEYQAEIRQRMDNLETNQQQIGQRMDNLESTLQESQQQTAQHTTTIGSLASNLQQQELLAAQHTTTIGSLASNLQQQELLAVEQREVTAALAVTIAEMRSTTTSQEQCITQEDHQYLQGNLVNNYEDATQCIPVIPFGKVALPLNRLFSPVVVAEEINSRKITRKEMPSERKQIQETVEIFYSEDKPVERIFMKGEAGRGKTVYGLKLSEEWCKVKQGIQSDMLEVLSQFEFLFHVSMRYVEPDKTKVVDMICDSLSKGDDRLIRLITRVLRDNGIRCLVILDGLDEWSTNSDEFPNIYGLVNCVLFITTRPWKLEKLQMDYTLRDKVVEILGINPQSIDTLITRIVTELYGSDDQVLTDRLISYCQQRAEDPKLKELMKLPMILTASCYVWCEEETDDREPRSEKNADKSMTYFSFALVDMLIQRAEKNNKEVKDYLKKHCNEQTVPKSATHSMMALLCEFFPKIVNFLDVLTPLCKVAYNDLMSKQTCLVFRREKLEKEIGTSIVELALKVGIISQCWAPGRGINIQNVSVSFFHKLIQEIMAAIYIIRSPDGLQTLCDQCPSLDKVLDLSNVFMYVSGLDSSVGCGLSQHVARVTQTDHVIALYRQTMGWEGRDKVRRLYHSHLTCYREMVHVSSMMGIPHPPPYHISDVYLDRRSDSEVVRVTGEIMSNTHHTVVSVWLSEVPAVSGIIRYLPQHYTTLTALCFVRCDKQSGERLVTVLPLLVHLQYLGYGGHNSDVEADVVAAMTRLTRLKYLWLWYITLGNTPLCVSHMTQLETLVLGGVHMTAGGWEELVSDLLSIPHKVKVTLYRTDIDAYSSTRILSSPQVTDIKHHTDSGGSTDSLEFYNKT